MLIPTLQNQDKSPPYPFYLQNTCEAYRHFQSGAEFIGELEKIGIDVFITGDLKHHQALKANKMTIIDLGHFHSERFVVEIFEKILSEQLKIS